MYVNYHKHTTHSSIFTPDSHIHIKDYMMRAMELNHSVYFTTEHGFGGDIFEAMDMKEKIKKEHDYDIKVCFGLEGYIVKDPLEKDNSNYHIILIARTDKARKKLNKINSRANKEGYYYKPRIFIEDLLKLDKDDIYITTACVSGIIKDDNSFNDIFIPLYNHFKENIFIEVQSHDEIVQKTHNRKAIKIAEDYGLRLIHGNDSHYIYPEQSKDRIDWLKGKGINYGDEDSFILDYPDEDMIHKRYAIQGTLTYEQICEALETTMLLQECEEIQINKSIKMPNIYKNLTPEERFQKLRRLIYDKWVVENEKLPKEKHQEYIDAISFELNIIKETNEDVHTADYFLLNEKVVDRAVNKYNGVLTRTGRGSGVSYYINRLLGFTGIDRLALDVPIYPTRFISKSRLLETKSLPDFDFNCADPQPFIDATKDVIGENSCAWMLAYGTMKESEAFRNVCRNKEIDFKDFNEIGKDLEGNKNHPKWGKIIEESKKFVGSIVSVSPHPCANIIMDGDIEEEIGVIRIKDKMCAIITSYEADVWKYLKNDYLTVSVWDIISKTFKLANKDIIDVPELVDNLDNKIWELYAKGNTATLNQADTDFAKNIVMRYKPKNYGELSAFVAAIRPGFASLLNTFVERKKYTNGVEALDVLLSTTNNFMLYQESVMQYLVWLGIPEDITYGIVKKIAKKKFEEKELAELKTQLKEKWIEKVHSEDGFDESWQVVEDNAKYSFNASHSISVALDSLYGAYLKVNYPLEYYKVILEQYQKNIDETNKITNELKYFNIQLKPARFRYSNSSYNIDKETNTIYKSISSIKYLNENVGNELYELKDNKYNSFLEALPDIMNTSINSKQLNILIELDFFSEFGKSQKLLTFVEYYDKIYGAKVITKKKLEEEWVEDIVKNYSRETKSQYRDLEIDNILLEIWQSIIDKDITIKEKINAQMEYLGYINFNLDTDKMNCIILKMDTKYKPKLTVMSLATGKTIVAKMTKELASNLEQYDIIKIKKMEQQFGWTKDDNDKWIRDKSRKEWHIKKCIKIGDDEL